MMISQVLGSSKVQEAVRGRKKEEVRVMIDTQDLNVDLRNCPVSMQKNNEENREGLGQFWAVVPTDSENGPL